jgi:hypothetical protein
MMQGASTASIWSKYIERSPQMQEIPGLVHFAPLASIRDIPTTPARGAADSTVDPA